MLNCKQASQLISKGLEGELSLSEKIGLRWHLWMCNNCRRFEKQMGQLRQALRRGWTHGNIPVDKTLSDQAKDRIRRGIREHTSDSKKPF